MGAGTESRLGHVLVLRWHRAVAERWRSLTADRGSGWLGGRSGPNLAEMGPSLSMGGEVQMEELARWSPLLALLRERHQGPPELQLIFLLV